MTECVVFGEGASQSLEDEEEEGLRSEDRYVCNGVSCSFSLCNSYDHFCEEICGQNYQWT
jgi:hypothetical protein